MSDVWFTNPRIEMAPDDFAPDWDPGQEGRNMWDPTEQGAYDDDPNVYDGTYSDGGDDE